jgi:diaminopimelate epimerase
MVTLPGGPLEIEWTADGRIVMSGPVEEEHAGVLEDHDRVTAT